VSFSTLGTKCHSSEGPATEGEARRARELAITKKRLSQPLQTRRRLEAQVRSETVNAPPVAPPVATPVAPKWPYSSLATTCPSPEVPSASTRITSQIPVFTSNFDRTQSPSWLHSSPQNLPNFTDLPTSPPTPYYSFKATSPNPGLQGASPKKPARKQQLRDQYHNTSSCDIACLPHGTGAGLQPASKRFLKTPAAPMNYGAAKTMPTSSKASPPAGAKFMAATSNEPSPPASPRQATHQDQVGRAPLHNAMLSKDPQAVKTLLDTGKQCRKCWTQSSRDWALRNFIMLWGTLLCLEALHCAWGHFTTL
jgi:hypothetical protein